VTDGDPPGVCQTSLLGETLFHPPVFVAAPAPVTAFRDTDIVVVDLGDSASDTGPSETGNSADGDQASATTRATRLLSSLKATKLRQTRQWWKQARHRRSGYRPQSRL
jgi:hypothetical protein